MRNEDILNKLNDRTNKKWNLKNKDFKNNTHREEKLLELITKKNFIIFLRN